MANYHNHKKGIKLSSSDLEMLYSLYKSDFLCDYHLSIIIGESKSYCTKRLRDLATAGLDYEVRNSESRITAPECKTANSW